MINVTRSAMPDYMEYCNSIKELWETRHLTNYGENHNKLEKELTDYLQVKHLVPVCNGTVALLLAIDALELPEGSGIITTPFSFVATSSSILWQNHIPVFADVEADTFNLDPDKLRKKIDSKTKAILAVHVFGNPCNVDKLQELADEYGLKVLYDAAHCFGVSYKGKSILTYGDLSTLSFHATKVFHTIEGGAICTSDDTLAEKARKKCNFGQGKDRLTDEIGINGKLNEFQAIMGLLNLKNLKDNLKKRRILYLNYIDELKDLHITFQRLNCTYDDYNYSYFPVLFEDSHSRDKAFLALQSNNIMSRKYFYPLISDMAAYSAYDASDTPIAKDLAERVLTLPLYPDLDIVDAVRIADIIKSAFK
ncbi:MAG: DegT/DnrJ/EryC1/StrS family aminotransferase [Pseudomonadota bacterium]